MITIWYNNTTACMMRPTPLISISQTPLRNRVGKFGSSYDITLNGTIISHGGSPFYFADTDGGGTVGGNGPLGGHDGGGFSSTISKPSPEDVSNDKALDSILSKQNAIRQLFAIDGQKMEIQAVDGSTPRIVCYPSVESISFDEGTYVDFCRFTITLSATTLLDSAGKVLADGGIFGTGDQTEQELLDTYGGFIEDYNDVWSVEVDESYGSTGGTSFVPRAYRISRNLSATGRNSHVDSSIGGDPSLSSVTKREAWSQAKDFIKKYTGGNSTISGYPQSGPIASGFLDLEGYAGYNHVRTENIDQAAGTYQITDTWLMASGDSALENYSASISSSTDGAFVSVSVDGSIKGISSTPASGYGGLASSTFVSPYSRARTKYLAISNNGNFGVGSQVYKRVNSLTNLELNSQPASISIGSNEFTGEITYNVSFDNRPVNVFTGVASEAISVNDTYPGDLYASIPVLGRTTGPVLQYIGGRTEYKRDVTIEIVLDHTDIGYGNKRTDLMLRKPSINQPIRDELKNLIIQVSPASEPGIRKYFLSPPTESWNPKTGSYSLNLSWTYELDS